MGYIELTFCGDWTELPELNTRFQVSFLSADPEFVEDVRFVGGRAECLEPEDLAMIAEHTGIIHAELSFDGGDKYKAAIEAIELARTLFANGGTGLFIETATKPVKENNALQKIRVISSDYITFNYYLFHVRKFCK